MPALNEEETIYKVLNSVSRSICDSIVSELLVINDGSSDNTQQEAIKAGATVINHNYNKGVGSAFQTAVNYALKKNIDILVSIDADGQFDVNQIENMTEPIVNYEADFCIGNRFDSTKPLKMPRIKFWGNKQISKIVSFISKTIIKDASCGFRAYSKDCLLSLNLQGDFTYTHETILDLLNKGYRVKQIPVNVTYFEERVSRIANNIFKYAFKTSVIIFKCLKDYKPLRFFSWIAFLVLFISMTLGGFVAIHWYVNEVITPYKSIGIIALSLLGMSVFLFVLAFLADMLNRIRNNQEKLLYLIKKKYFEEN
tara:strand:- start:1664 stop:2596 length:933 start_codon:yes stop_codon:yes gene_type:complete